MCSNGDQSRETVPLSSLHLETKTFSQEGLDGGQRRIFERFNKARSIVTLSSVLVVWLAARLSWKGSHPRSLTEKLLYSFKEESVSLSERCNCFGRFVILEVRRQKGRTEFLHIPGGWNGELWLQFSDWLSQDPPMGVGHRPQEKLWKLIEELKDQISVLNRKLVLAAKMEAAAFLPSFSRKRKLRKKRKGARPGDALMTFEQGPVAKATSVLRVASHVFVTNDASQPVRDFLQPGNAGGDASSRTTSSACDRVGAPSFEPGHEVELVGFISSPLPSNLVVADTFSSSSPSPLLVTETISNIFLKNRSSHSKSTRIRPRWMNRILLHKLAQEKITCQAWDDFTTASRQRKGESNESVSRPFSEPPPIMDLHIDLEGALGFPACNLASENTEAFLVCDSVANQEPSEGLSGVNHAGILSGARDVFDITSSSEQTCDPSSDVIAEYPEFLINLVDGSVSLATWLGSMDVAVVQFYKPGIVQIGKIFYWEDLSIHGLTFWKVLTSLPTIRSNAAFFRCWKRLVGSPVLDFLHQQGLEIDEAWLVDGPPCLLELG